MQYLKIFVLILSLSASFGCKKEEIPKQASFVTRQCTYCDNAGPHIAMIFRKQKINVCDECFILTFDLMLGRVKGDEQ